MSLSRLRVAYLATLIEITKPLRVSQEVLEDFHSRDFIGKWPLIDDKDFLLTHDPNDPDFDENCEFDCPLFEGITDYVRLVAGGTYAAAQALASGESLVAIHWDGGRHHAMKDAGAGFCYVNDIVIGILELSRTFKRVLYVDLDIHHGDGVSAAFYHTNKVFCLSFHRFDPGFFPGTLIFCIIQGTGYFDEIGKGSGKYHNLNIPLKPGLASDRFYDLTKDLLSRINDAYQPEAIVVVCGTDGLAKDPLVAQGNEGWNLDGRIHSRIVSLIRQFDCPLMLLGGGGYHNENAARCLARCTAAALGINLQNDVPEHEFYERYGPDFSLDVDPSQMKDSNTDEYIQGILEKAHALISRTRKT